MSTFLNNKLIDSQKDDSDLYVKWFLLYDNKDIRCSTIQLNDSTTRWLLQSQTCNLSATFSQSILERQ